jgi:hypothetical protein
VTSWLRIMTPWMRRSPYALTAREVADLTLRQADWYVMDWLRELEQQKR